MKVDIWSDIMCPFCYIGKRRFEEALEAFPHNKDVQVYWRSFQLEPDLITNPGQDIYDYLAEKKGWSRQYSEDVHNNLSGVALEAGLEYHFESAIVANTFNAHRLLHLAAARGLQNNAGERLFRAYFTEGLNLDVHDTLVQVGEDIGIPKTETISMLHSDVYAREVEGDIRKAAQLGVSGVPFFVFDDKFAVSGAQPAEVFANALDRAWSERAFS